MIIYSNFSTFKIDRIADSLGLKLSEVKSLREDKKKMLWACDATLHLGSTGKFQAYRPNYRDETKDRRINAVCFHGYYEFAEELFRQDFQAQIKSSLTQRNGNVNLTAINFDFLAEQLGNFNMGSQIKPRCYKTMCKCIDNENLEKEILTSELDWQKDAKSLVRWATSNLEYEFINRHDLSPNLIEELSAELSSIGQTWLTKLELKPKVEM